MCDLLLGMFVQHALPQPATLVLQMSVLCVVNFTEGFSWQAGAQWSPSTRRDPVQWHFLD